MSAGDGDGWVMLSDGSRRWGRFGSAGLLLHADGHRPRGAAAGPAAHGGPSGRGKVLMQHRALNSHQGGMWGVPGGACNSDETPVQAALREFGEEVAGETGEIELIGLHRQEHTVWRYDTLLARTAVDAPLEAANWESDEVRWVGMGDVAELDLLPAFGRTWPLLRGALTWRLVLHVDAAAVLPGADAESPERLELLRDELAGLAAAGVAADALPEAMPRCGLHLWFPRIRLAVGSDSPAPEAVPGVDVVRERPGVPAAGAGGADPAGGVRTVALLVADRPAGAAAGEEVHTVPPEWLATAAAGPPGPRAAASEAPQA
ncbi:hypothetical protein GCM10027570_33360 [Streptomonospora sediminis]